MAGARLLRRLLHACPAEAASLAPYGTLIATEGRAFEWINDASTRRYGELAALDLRGPASDPVIGIYVAQARAFPLPIARLEQHREASQVFLPLGPHRFVLVVAPGESQPLWDEVQAFLTAPGQGFALRRGCWHHGLVALGDGDRFAVIEGGNYRGDCAVAEAPEPLELAAPDAR